MTRSTSRRIWRPTRPNLPSSEPVAENDGTVIMRVAGDYMMRTPDGEWSHWAAAR